MKTGLQWDQRTSRCLSNFSSFPINIHLCHYSNKLWVETLRKGGSLMLVTFPTFLFKENVISSLIFRFHYFANRRHGNLYVNNECKLKKFLIPRYYYILLIIKLFCFFVPCIFCVQRHESKNNPALIRFRINYCKKDKLGSKQMEGKLENEKEKPRSNKRRKGRNTETSQPLNERHDWMTFNYRKNSSSKGKWKEREGDRGRQCAREERAGARCTWKTLWQTVAKVGGCKNVIASFNP